MIFRHFKYSFFLRIFTFYFLYRTVAASYIYPLKKRSKAFKANYISRIYSHLKLIKLLLLVLSASLRKKSILFFITLIKLALNSVSCSAFNLKQAFINIIKKKSLCYHTDDMSSWKYLCPVWVGRKETAFWPHL